MTQIFLIFLRWMCGTTRRDMIRIDNIRESVEVALTVEKMVENRFNWFDM